MSSDNIFDLTAGVYLTFYNIVYRVYRRFIPELRPGLGCRGKIGLS